MHHIVLKKICAKPQTMSGLGHLHLELFDLVLLTYLAEGFQVKQAAQHARFAEVYAESSSPVIKDTDHLTRISCFSKVDKVRVFCGVMCGTPHVDICTGESIDLGMIHDEIRIPSLSKHVFGQLLPLISGFTRMHGEHTECIAQCNCLSILALPFLILAPMNNDAFYLCLSHSLVKEEDKTAPKTRGGTEYISTNYRLEISKEFYEGCLAFFGHICDVCVNVEVLEYNQYRAE